MVFVMIFVSLLAVAWNSMSDMMGLWTGRLESSVVNVSLNSSPLVSQKLRFGVLSFLGVVSSRMLRMGMWSVQSRRLGSV